MRVVRGLPSDLTEKIFWVGRKYRTNPLSHEPGGSDVVVVYDNGDVFGYDWIKMPDCYVAAITNRNGRLEEIVEIYARMYHNEEYYGEPFELAWDHEESWEDPITALKRYRYAA